MRLCSLIALTALSVGQFVLLGLPTLSFCEPAHKKILNEIISKKLGVALSISVHSPDSSLTLSLALPKSSRSNPQVFAVPDPSRLVIDIVGLPLTVARTYPVANNALITAIRIGSHPDKVRLVLDIAPHAQNLSHRVISTDDGFSVVLSANALAVQPPEPSAAPTALPPTSTPAPSITEHPPATATSLPTAAPSNTPLPQQVSELKITVAAPSPTPAVPLTAVSTDVAGNQTLTAIAFDYVEPERSPAVRLKFSQRPQFKLSKVNEAAYRLSVPKALLSAQSLSLPQFPPQDFVGFTLIHAMVREARLEILIGVDRGTRVTAVTKENDIMIRSEQP